MISELHEILPYAVNFSIVVAVVTFFARKPFQRLVFQRHEHLKDFIEASAKVFETAQARHKLIAEKLSNVEKEEREILANEIASAKKEAEEIVAKGKAEAERTKNEAARMAAAESADIESRVKAQFLDQVLKSVESRLKEDLKSDDHKKIVRQAQSSIEVGA